MADTFFAVTAPGLEPFIAQELRALKLLPQEGPLRRSETGLTGEESGGVTFEGGLGDLYRANLCLRTASRVLVRLGDFFATSFPELRKRASRLPWERYLRPGQPVSLHVTCRKSRSYHSGAVAERVAGAIADKLGKTSPVVRPEDRQKGEPAQMVVVRLVNNACTISLDTSGELLHRRGYRLETAKAPLRETLAAGLLLASGWDGVSPLLDPLCGSGTIAIEGALMAANLPPGRLRSFAFMHWPGYEQKRWQSLLGEYPSVPTGDLPSIQASDRDAGAVRIAQANAERAGVLGQIEFSVRAISAIEPPPGPGWVVTNPPYGARVSASRDLRNLYAQLGNVLRAHCPGWQAAILSSDIALLGQTGLPLDHSLALVNGGIPVRLGRGTVTR
jgi:putative N6-adenine-specific DNA methylase